MSAVRVISGDRIRLASQSGLRLSIACILTSLLNVLPAADQPPATPDESIYGIELTADQRGHWSFRPLNSQKIATSVPVAATIPQEWTRNPIDAFVWQTLNDKQLTPSPAADPRVWLRRVYFDLIGLPPTPAQIDEFLADTSLTARAQIVDRLLADPGYGIRWGRRWLDLVRYADTNGYERDGDKPSAWRYRDYVIESLNSDKPFDEFLTEQLAGDEIDQVTADTMIATTFLRLGTWDDEPADPVVDRYDQLDDVLKGVSSTFLGLTLNCARCHNHKFEPLSQIDYTRMLAVFAPLERPREGRTEFDLPVGTAVARRQYHELQARSDAAVKLVTTQLAELEAAVQMRYLASEPKELSADARAAFLAADSQRSDAQKLLVKQFQKKLNEFVSAAHTPDERRQREGFQAALKSLRAAAPTGLPRAYIFQEPLKDLPPVQVFRRGDPSTPAGAVQPGIPDVLGESTMLTVTAPQDRQTSGRRLALARWMTDPANPLVARVIVNRIWQGHFGEGLVHTENDFGVMGYPPTHPELLDWLALNFQQGGWRLKDLHRQIVLSNTYGQASTWRAEASRIDQPNNFLWRFPYRRLEGEPIRDAVLASNGTLNFKLGGPGVYPQVSSAVLAGQSRPGSGWGKSTPDEASRRSAFVFVKRSLLLPFLELLDLPDTTTACEQRNVSTIPTQALTMLNGDFLSEQSQHLARRLRREVGSQPEQQVVLAYRLTLGRTPESDELTRSVTFIQQRQASYDAVERDGALAAWCLVLYNLNEFVYID